jgi:hypothetical protein
MKDTIMKRYDPIKAISAKHLLVTFSQSSSFFPSGLSSSSSIISSPSYLERYFSSGVALYVISKEYNMQDSKIS